MAVKPLKLGSNKAPRQVQANLDEIAVKGIDLEDLGTHRLYRSGNDIYLLDPTKGAKSLSNLLDAEQEDFDPGLTDLVSVKTGPAIRELRGIVNFVAAGTIYPVRAFYNGNASVGRYLEVFPGAATDTAPDIVPVTSEIIYITVGTDNTSGDFSVGVFEIGDLVNPIVTVTLLDGVSSGGFTVSGALDPLDQLAFRVTAGTRQKPRFTAYINTAGLA